VVGKLSRYLVSAPVSPSWASIPRAFLASVSNARAASRSSSNRPPRRTHVSFPGRFFAAMALHAPGYPQSRIMIVEGRSEGANASAARVVDLRRREVQVGSSPRVKITDSAPGARQMRLAVVCNWRMQSYVQRWQKRSKVPGKPQMMGSRSCDVSGR
jgi:hypothetical protein